MSKFYIDLKMVNPYIKYLNQYNADLKRFISRRDQRFHSVRSIFDDETVERFLQVIRFVDTGLLKLTEETDRCAETMQREAIAYQQYLNK